LGNRSTIGSFSFLNSACEWSHANFEFLTWREGLTFLWVDDLSGTGDSSRTGESSGDFYYDAGSAWNDDGARYEWRLDTPDGKTATFRINDKEYDISQGTLFVIKAKGDKVEVHQLNRDLSALPIDGPAIHEFLKNDAEVRKIFGVKDQDK
jgi:hypothetical protein